MILKPVESSSDAATIHSTRSTPGGLAEENGLKWLQKGDFNRQMSFAIFVSKKWNTSMFYKNRQDAGQVLGQLLQKYKGQDVVVYALPRGGVVVAEEIAKSLHAPLDLIFAHKIGHPYQPEYAIAAVSESGHLIESHKEESMGRAWLESEKKIQLDEMKQRRAKYLKGKKQIPAKDKIAILVDDGIATGLTMKVGIEELKSHHPKKLIVAVPIAPKSTADTIKTMVDEFVGTAIEDYDFLGAVGAYYDIFEQVEDEEVIEILQRQSKWVGK